MTDLPQPLTTKSFSKPATRFLSAEQHLRWIGSNVQETIGKQFGRVIVLDSNPKRENGYWKVEVRCITCERTSWVDFHSLTRGRTQGCQPCSSRDRSYRPTSLWPAQVILGRRYDAIVQRCANPTCKVYKWYGGRGIQNLFGSRMEFITWVSTNLPHTTYKGIEIDRIDNNGHYAPGNLRLATRKQQIDNRGITVWTEFRGMPVRLTDFLPFSPYTPDGTRSLVRQGLNGDQIIEAARRAVQNRRKCWRQIAQRLVSLGYTIS